MKQLLFNFENICNYDINYIDSLNYPIELTFRNIKNKSFLNLDIKITSFVVVNIDYQYNDLNYDYDEVLVYDVICFDNIKSMLFLLEQNEFDVIKLQECRKNR